MSQTIPRRITFSLLFSIIIIFTISTLIWESIERLLDSSKWEVHTYKVINELDQILSDLKDIETGTRGFVITGKEDFLEPYLQASKNLDSNISTLRAQITDYTLRELKLSELKNLIDEKVKIQKEAIQIRKQNGLKAAEEFVSLGFGKKTMDEIRQKAFEIMEGEKELLQKRISKRENSARNMFIVSGILVSLFILATLMVFVFLKKEFVAREKAQKLLKDASEYTQMIIDTIVTPLLVLDSDMHIISASRSFYRSYINDSKKIGKSSLISLFDGELNREDLVEKLYGVLEQGLTIENYEIPLNSGRLIQLNARKLYRLGNHTMMILLGIDDITEKKQAQQKQTEYTFKLEKLNEDKDKFFSIIAHDLKNPFTSLLGFSQLLAMHSEDLSKKEIKEYSENLFNSTRNIYRLLEDLLQWARVQSGRSPLEEQELKVRSLIEDNINLFKYNAASKDISLEIETDSTLLLRADKNSADTILRNLLANAIKFTPRSGKINIAGNKKEREILISVKDTGVGMTEHTLSKLFKLGENISTDGTNNEKGTGLGLILCKDLVEKNGGRIWAESMRGKGSTFYFTLPCFTENNLEETS